MFHGIPGVKLYSSLPTPPPPVRRTHRVYMDANPSINLNKYKSLIFGLPVFPQRNKIIIIDIDFVLTIYFSLQSDPLPPFFSHTSANHMFDRRCFIFKEEFYSDVGFVYTAERQSDNIELGIILNRKSRLIFCYLGSG